MIKEAMSEFGLKFMSYVATVLVTVVLSGTGYWMMIGRNIVTRDEAYKMVEDRVHISEEKTINRVSTIEQKIDGYTETNHALKQVIEKNTDAIKNLEIQIAILNNTLEFIKDSDKKKND